MSGYDRARIKVERAVRTEVLAYRLHQERRCVVDICFLSVIPLTPYQSAARELPGRVARAFVAGLVCLLGDELGSCAAAARYLELNPVHAKLPRDQKRVFVEQRSGPGRGA